jgi:hypothetical protein
MPNAAKNGFDPELFAKLMARSDTGNPSEAEAISAFRLLRRSLVVEDLRLVDVMGRTDVMRALDVQLQPVREKSPELKAALLDNEMLVDLAKEREEYINDLQKDMKEAPRWASSLQSPQILIDKLLGDGLLAAVSLAVCALLIEAVFR